MKQDNIDAILRAMLDKVDPPEQLTNEREKLLAELCLRVRSIMPNPPAVTKYLHTIPVYDYESGESYTLKIINKKSAPLVGGDGPWLALRTFLYAGTVYDGETVIATGGISCNKNDFGFTLSGVEYNFEEVDTVTVVT